MNKSEEQLNSEVCASDGLYKALTSPLMKINCVFIISIIILSFFYSFKALKILWKHNIFSNCTQLILIICSINSIVHQTTMMEIRIRQIHRSFACNDNQCGIQFHSSECFIELYFYYITNYLSTYSVFSLTSDRFISYKFPSFYLSKQYPIAVVLLFIQLCLSIGTHCFGFLGVSLAGYVPMCTYPPQLATNFDTINQFRTIIMIVSIVLTLVILYLSVKTEKKVHQENYNTKTRYTAFENMTTSKSICILIILQFACIMISSYGVTLIRKIEYLIPQEVYHTIVPFLPGVTYANLCLPVVIFYTTKRTIRRRKNKIGEMTSNNGDVETHMNWLKETWN